MRRFAAPPDYLIAYRLYRKGAPLDEVAGKMGVSRKVAKRNLRRMGLLFRTESGFPKRFQPFLARMAEMRAGGDSYRRIGQAVGLDPKWVMRLLRGSTDDNQRV